MNYLNLRQGPQIDFIIPEHKNDFENHLIDTYIEATKNELGMYGLIPTIEENIIPNINAKYILAGFLGHATGDLSFYIKEYKGKLLPDFEPYWATGALNQYAEEHPELVKIAMAGTYGDIASIFEFHNICHAAQLGVEVISGDELITIRNVPIVQIW